MLEDYPVILAENRDTRMGSVEIPPSCVSVDPKIYCAIDEYSQGTWFGLNEYGVVVGLSNLYSNRKQGESTHSTHLRGELCLDALKQSTAEEVSEYLSETFDPAKYSQLNMISADADSAFILKCDENTEIIELKPGIHVLTNYNFGHEPATSMALDLMVDSKHRRDRATELIEGYLIEDYRIKDIESAINILKIVLSDHEEADYLGGSKYKEYFTICCHGNENYPWETKSSSIIALPEGGPENSIYLYADGNPCNIDYADCSSILKKKA